MKTSTKQKPKRSLISRTVEFTELGISFHYHCPHPLCTYSAHHLMRHDELAAHKRAYNVETRQAVLDNYRFFKSKIEKHEHLFWSYEI